MTRQSTKQHGVSLVEVMLTLAISSMLIATVLAGRNSLRSQAQFSDSIERIKETILSTKNEANTGNNTVGTGTTATGRLTLGRSIYFQAGQANAVTRTVLCTANADNLCTNQLLSPLAADRSLPLPWGSIYTGCRVGNQDCIAVTGQNNMSLFFVREDTSGDFTGYWFPGQLTSNPGTSVPRTNVYQAARQSPVALLFRSPDGRTATINVNPAAGTVTRTIQ